MLYTKETQQNFTEHSSVSDKRVFEASCQITRVNVTSRHCWRLEITRGGKDDHADDIAEMKGGYQPDQWVTSQSFQKKGVTQL